MDKSLDRTCCRCGGDCETKRILCDRCRSPILTWEERENLRSRELTFRDRQVIAAVRQGKENKEIAYDLMLSQSTIKQYVSRILWKLDLHNRVQLAVWEMEREARENRVAA